MIVRMAKIMYYEMEVPEDYDKEETIEQFMNDELDCKLVDVDYDSVYGIVIR